MRKILMSLVMIVAVASIVTGATKSIFTSQAVLGSNTFATGVLEIRVNGLATAPGFTFGNAAPGDSVTTTFSLQNYGAPWFPGPSTLNAEGLFSSASQTGGDAGLYGALQADLFANAGWGGCTNPGVVFVSGKGCQVYSGALSGLTNADVLNATQWGVHPSLVPGNSFTMTLDVTLPTTADDTLQGKSTVFDLIFNAQNPWP